MTADLADWMRTHEHSIENSIPRPPFPHLRRVAGHDEAIRAGLATNTAATVWQRLRHQGGLSASLASLLRHVHLTLPEEGGPVER